MQPLRRNINPFALMLDPQAVIAEIERSGRLEQLQRRVCRPLDKPLLGGVADSDENSDAVNDARAEFSADAGVPAGDGAAGTPGSDGAEPKA